MRHATRYGLRPGTDLATWSIAGPIDALDPDRGWRRARAAALVTFALPGSAYVYQGEELGLPEVWDLSIDTLEDPVWTRSGMTQKGRDGCRVPIPWTREGPSFGFGGVSTWLPQPAHFGEFAVEGQENVPASTLNLYRRSIELRRQWLGGDEHVELLDLGPDVLAFVRGSGVRCVVNMGTSAVVMPPGDVLISSGDVGTLLPTDTAVWLAPISPNSSHSSDHHLPT
jgi:alpha-glucosidase